MPPEPTAINVSPTANPTRVWSTARAKCPRQYTNDKDRMVRYFPNQTSAIKAPTTGKKYTADAKR